MTPAHSQLSWYGRSQQIIHRNYGTVRGFVRAMLANLEYVLGRVDEHVQLDHGNAKQVERLVFVCLGNINRSAFAQQVALQLSVNACSIGLSTTSGAPAFSKAVETAPQFGVNLSAHRATDLKDYSFRKTDLLLVMEIRHARQLVALGIAPQSIGLLGYWATPRRIHLHDPHTLSDAYFRTCFTLIDSSVRALVIELRLANSACLQA